jgi:hypothetical protein
MTICLFSMGLFVTRTLSCRLSCETVPATVHSYDCTLRKDANISRNYPLPNFRNAYCQEPPSKALILSPAWFAPWLRLDAHSRAVQYTSDVEHATKLGARIFILTALTRNATGSWKRGQARMLEWAAEAQFDGTWSFEVFGWKNQTS